MTIYYPRPNYWIWLLLSPGMTVFFHAISADGLYKLFLYLSPILVGISLYHLPKQNVSIPTKGLASIALFPLALIIIQLLATSTVALKETSQILLYTATGMIPIVAIKAIRFEEKIFKTITLFTACLITSYATIQIIAVYILDKQYGTLKNPHLLAQYCLLFLLITASSYKSFTSTILKALIITSAIALVALLIKHTSSRSAWIPLISCLILINFLQQDKLKARLLTTLVATALLLYYSDFGNLQQKMAQFNSSTSVTSRLEIWHDTILMQNESSIYQWIFGHGIDSFYPDFKNYSTWHSRGHDYNAPHNHVLELIYTTGMIGLLTTVSVIIYLYILLFSYYKHSNKSVLSIILISTLTANLFFTSVTISFFRSYSLLILALIGGLTIALQDHHESNHADHPQL
jgi:hypothetical protein